MSARAEDAARALSREQPTTADAAVPAPANNGSADAEGVEIPAPEPSGNKNLPKHFSENHLCGAKELFASPRKFFRIPPPLSIETLRKSAENPGFSARVSFFCPRLRFFTQDRPFCMARELILATIDD